MGRTLKEIIAALPPARQECVEARYRTLKAEIERLRQPATSPQEPTRQIEARASRAAAPSDPDDGGLDSEHRCVLNKLLRSRQTAGRTVLDSSTIAFAETTPWQ